MACRDIREADSAASGNPYIARELVRLSGIAQQAGIDVLDRRWVGIDYSGHEPWYVTGIRGWIARYRAIMESQWDKADTHRAVVEKKLATENPVFLYAYFERFEAFLKADMARRT